MFCKIFKIKFRIIRLNCSEINTKYVQIFENSFVRVQNQFDEKRFDIFEN